MFKIYVGNLDYKVKVEQLRELFSVFAPIEDLVIPTDPATGKAKGFAIVMIRDPELGQAAVKAMQSKRLMGRALVVNEAVKKKKGAVTPTKADLIRNGPFGPRLNRFGDTRAGGSRPSRNPRRGGGTAPRLGGQGLGGGSSTGVGGSRSGGAGEQAQPTRADIASSSSPRGTPQLGSASPSNPPRPAIPPSPAPQETRSSPPTPPSGAAPQTPPAQPLPVRAKAQKLAAPKRPDGNSGG